MPVNTGLLLLLLFGMLLAGCMPIEPAGSPCPATKPVGRNLPALTKTPATGMDEPTESRPDSVRAAIYAGTGTWDESITAVESMFQWMGAKTERLGAYSINEGDFDDFDILLIPGGDMYQYDQDITSQGDENIREFIRSGGCYIGICGGAFFASQEVIWRGEKLLMSPLELFPGNAEGPINEIVPFPDYRMTTVEILALDHPITQSSPDTMLMLYYWGPVLVPQEGMDVSLIGKYRGVETPMIVAFDYGVGRVFLVGTPWNRGG
jgi:glutamine amidotransferase-like uncharacterized protein